MLFHCLLAFMVSVKVSTKSYDSSSEGNLSFSLATFKIISYSLIFGSFTLMCLSVMFFIFILLRALKGFLNLWIYVFQQLWKIPGHYLFKYCFCSILSLPVLFWDFNYNYVKTFSLCPKYDILFLYFPFFCLLMHHFGYFFLSSNSRILSSSVSNLL